MVKAAHIRSRRWRRPAMFALPILICCYYALSLGLHYGVSNQNSYLIRPLHGHDPSPLKNDWVTTEVTPHHGRRPICKRCGS